MMRGRIGPILGRMPIKEDVLTTHSPRPPVRLATFAAVAIAVWPAVVLALHALQRDSYDPAHQAMSELALGRYGFLLNLAFFAFGTGLLVLAFGLRRSLPKAAAGPGLVATAGLLVALSGAFQASRTGAPITTESIIHEILGVAAFVAVMAAMPCCAWRFRRDTRWRPFAAPTLTWAMASITTFVLIPLEAVAFGVAQRLFVATWLTWTFATALRLRTTTLPMEHTIRSTDGHRGGPERAPHPHAGTKAT